MSPSRRGPRCVPLTDGIDACAGVHGDETSAACVAAACADALREGRPYRTLALELPANWPAARVVGLVRAILPRPALLVAAGGGVIRLDEPIRDPDTGAVVSRAPEASFVPVSPTDSMSVAMALPALWARDHPDWKPDIALVDLPLVGAPLPGRHGTPALAGEDPCAMWMEGVSAWHAARMHLFRHARVDPFDLYREAFMAAEVRRLLREGGGPVLLVIGAAHLENICRFLRDPSASPPVPRMRRWRGAFSLVPVPARVMYLNGLLGKCPALAHVFWRRLAACLPYEPIEAVDRFLADCVACAPGKTLCPPGPREVLLMRRLAARRNQSRRTWISLPALLEAAEAAAGASFARLVHERTFEFPPDEDTSGAAGRPAARLVRTADGHWILFTEDGAFAGRLADGDGFVFPATLATLPEPPAPHERQALERCLCRREHPGETRLCRTLSETARAVSAAAVRRRISAAFAGSMRHGLDLRRTLRAQAAGLDQLYVFRTHREQTLLEDEQAPVVFLFEPEPALHPVCEATIIPRHPTDGDDTFGFSSLYWFSERTTLGETGIVQSAIAVLLNFYRGLLPPARRTLAEVELAVGRFRNPLCRTPPWTDPTLSGLAPGAQALCCAIRHARHGVVVVADSAYEPPPQVATLARDLGVRLCRVPFAAIPRDALERLRLDHTLPSPSHFEPSPEWLFRFVPPIRS